MEGEEGVEDGVQVATHKINYGTSQKPGLEGEVEDFEKHFSREYAQALAQKLTQALQESEDASPGLITACRSFLRFCLETLDYGRDLDPRELNEGKISPEVALKGLRRVLNEKFPVQTTRATVSETALEVSPESNK